MGRVTRLAVQEGQRVKAGQFLLEIDPRSLAGQIARGEASVAAARSSLQTHGAIGFTQEHDLSLLLLRVQALRSAWGDPTWHRRRVLEGLA